MRHLVLATSYSPKSRSAVLAEALARAFGELGDVAEVLVIPELDLPFCDGGASYGAAQVGRLREALGGADSVALATPVYNYDAGAGARNVLALGGEAWNGKAVGLMAAAGGPASYMAVMGLANSLMLGYRCLVAPRFVYATKGAFADGRIVSEEVRGRIDELARALRILAPAASELARQRS